MRTTAPSADSARPPGQPIIVQDPHTLLLIPTKKTDSPEHPAHCNHHKTPVRRNSTHFLRATMLTMTSASNTTLQWKNIHELHQLPLEHTIAMIYIQLLLDHLACNPLNVPFHVLHHLQHEIADDLSWLVGLASVLLPPQAHPWYGITAQVIPVPTELQLPYALASDIINQPPQTPENSNYENAHPYWNIIYDPTTDQLQVYANNRVRIYRRQRSSRRFTYLQGKANATFPIHSTIAIGHWENDYFVLVNHAPPPRTYSSSMKRLQDTPQRNSKAGLHVISALPPTSPRRPNPPRTYRSSMKRHKTLLNETARQAYMLLAPFFLPTHDDQARQAYMLLVPFHQLLSHDENARQAYKLLVPCTKLQLNATAKSFLLYLHYEPESLPLLECSADTLFHSLPSPKWF
jgi:hypothetical protein